jgi:hypothetical protein
LLAKVMVDFGFGLVWHCRSKPRVTRYFCCFGSLSVNTVIM